MRRKMAIIGLLIKIAGMGTTSAFAVNVNDHKSIKRNDQALTCDDQYRTLQWEEFYTVFYTR
ncbi:MAG: hypothetical protein KDC80_19745 [Saprospiraceae bacterium]|nr:hypothetical protein [Saprospiraceae bacterium]